MKNHLLAAFLYLAASILGVFAQAPANDNFASRYVVVGLSLSTNGTTVNATKESGEPAPFFNMLHSVWYEWTATNTGPLTVSFSGTYRPVLGVYTGTAVNGLSQVALASPGAGVTTTSLSFTPTPGVPYKIMVDGRAGASGTFTLSISQSLVPVVSLTAPASGIVVTNPVNVTVSATASSGGGSDHECRVLLPRY